MLQLRLLLPNVIFIKKILNYAVLSVAFKFNVCVYFVCFHIIEHSLYDFNKFCIKVRTTQLEILTFY